MIKSGEALEISHKVDAVVLDKTGTITEGKPTVMQVDKATAKVGKISFQNLQRPVNKCQSIRLEPRL